MATSCPDITGGTNWMSPAYNPKTGLFYVTAREVCATYYGWEQEFVQGQETSAARPSGRWPRLQCAARHRSRDRGNEMGVNSYMPSMAGILSTDSGLVFGGDMDGNVMAFDATSGKNLWHFQTGSSIWAAPITYMLDGRQLVVMPSGTTLYAFALPSRRFGRVASNADRSGAAAVGYRTASICRMSCSPLPQIRSVAGNLASPTLSRRGTRRSRASIS